MAILRPAEVEIYPKDKYLWAVCPRTRYMSICHPDSYKYWDSYVDAGWVAFDNYWEARSYHIKCGGSDKDINGKLYK